jgi:hypothetical protein
VTSCGRTILGTIAFLALTSVVRAQNPWDVVAVTPDGMALAQTHAAIDQSRLLRESAPPWNVGVDANGNALPVIDPTASSDDSFGEQQILKAQEKDRPFTLSGGVSFIYTDNVALTRNGMRDDVFAVIDAGMGWSPKLGNNLEANFGVHTALFRYFDTTALNFESLGVSTGVAWAPPELRGFAVFGRYDFSELLDEDADQILMDHTFTLGLQKSVAFGRSHGLTFGVLGLLGISDPHDAQRNQLAAFVDYRLQITRNLEADFLVRPAVHFYGANDRTDFNQILSANFRYRINNWAEATAFLSYSVNRSDRAVFDYNAFSSGAGVGLRIRF